MTAEPEPGLRPDPVFLGSHGLPKKLVCGAELVKVLRFIAVAPSLIASPLNLLP